MGSRRVAKTRSLASYLSSVEQTSRISYQNVDLSNSVASQAIGESALAEDLAIFDKSLQSGNYVAGYSGWKITGAGDAEFGNVVVRGDINASSGTIGYWNISTPAVTRIIGTKTLLGTFLESSAAGSSDDAVSAGTYVGLYKSYSPDPVILTYKSRSSNVATITVEDHEFIVGDKVVVDIQDVGDTTFNNSGIPVTITAITVDTFSYNNVGSDVASTASVGTVQLYNPDVAGLYLRDYAKASFDYGYFSNEGIKYVSAETYNLVHNPSFEYSVSNVATYSNTGWTLGSNLTLSSFDNTSNVTVLGVVQDLFKDDSVYTAYSGKVTWGTNSLSSSYASVDVNYELFSGLADLNKTLYFDFYAYFNPAGASIAATKIQRTSGSANVVVTALNHGLTAGEYVWNEFDAYGTIGENVNVNIDAYVPLKIVASTTTTFTVTVSSPATSSVNVTPLVQDRLYRYHPVAYKLTDIQFQLPNSNTISLYEVLAADTKAIWDANVAYQYFSLPYAKNSLGNSALPYHAVDDSSNFVIYNLPRLGPISATEGTLVPYEIKIDAAKFADLYSTRDSSGFASKTNVKLQFPGWAYRNEASPSTKMRPYSTTGIYIDNISLSTDKSFFYGGGESSSQSWYVDANKPNTASILSAKTWIDIDLETQTSYLNHTDYVSFKSPLLEGKLIKNSGIYTVNDVDNIDYKPINIGTALVSDYSSLLFTSGEYEYKLADNTYANYESLVSSRVEKDKSFLYLSTLYKNLNANGTYSTSDLNKLEASVTMATGSDQYTEVDINAGQIRMHGPAVYDSANNTWYSGLGDTYVQVAGDHYTSGNVSAGLDITAGNDLYVTNTAYITADLDVTGILTASGASLTDLNGSNVTSGVVDLAYGGTGSTSAPQAMATLTGYTSTATAGGTTVLTNASSYYQQFTGTLTQTVTLPSTSTLATGWTYHIVNNSTANVTVRTSTAASVIVVPSGTTAMVTCISTSVNTAAAWEAGLTDFSTYTGTGSVVLNTSPTLTTANISGALKFLGSSSNSVTFTVTGSTSNQGNLVIDSGTTQIFGTLPAAPTFTIRGATSQTGELQLWQDSAGGTLAYMDKNGSLTANVVNANSVAANLSTSFGYPVANVANLGTNVATFLTTPSSANLRNAVTDEAGTGALVFRASTAAASNDLAVGWYTIAYNVNSRASAKFIVTDTRVAIHQVVVFQASNLYHVDTAAGITVLQQSAFSLASAPIQKIRIKNGTSSGDGAVLQVYVEAASNSLTAYMYENDIPNGWVMPTNWVADASDPGVGVYANLTAVTEVNLDSGGSGKNQMLVTGDIYAGVNATSHVIASQSYSVASNTTYTLATNNTNQSAFPALANGAPLESGVRYEFEGVLVLSHTLTWISGNISDTIYTNFSTPTLYYGWVEYNYTTSTSSLFTAGTLDTVTDDVVTLALGNDVIANSITRSSSGSTTGYVYVRFRGSLKTAASGYLLPRVKFNLSLALGDGSNSGAIQAGSWMRVSKVAETTSGWT